VRSPRLRPVSTISPLSENPRPRQFAFRAALHPDGRADTGGSDVPLTLPLNAIPLLDDLNVDREGRVGAGRRYSQRPASLEKRP